MKRKYWAGFYNGHLDLLNVDTGFGGHGTGNLVKMPAAFASKADARKQYEDVRQIEIGMVNYDHKGRKRKPVRV